jgi:serine/threonine-protein kinase mTOR
LKPINFYLDVFFYKKIFYYFKECLINGEAVNTTASVSRYLNNLRCLFPCGDANIMELAARTLVKLGQLPGAKGAESFEYEIKKAFEFISEDKNDVSLGFDVK